MTVFCSLLLQSLLGAVRQVQSSLETEQEKLASLERNLSGTAEDPIPIPASSEQGVSEEWLQSLKGRRDVSSSCTFFLVPDPQKTWPLFLRNRLAEKHENWCDCSSY